MSLDVVFFELRGRRCAMPVSAVSEVAAMPGMTPVPLAPPVVRGIAPLHGQVVPVLDLGVWLSPGPESPPLYRPGSDKVLLIEASSGLEGTPVRAALIVERVMRLGTIDETHARPPPSGPAFVSATVLDVEGPALLIDANRVVDQVREAIRQVVRSMTSPTDSARILRARVFAIVVTCVVATAAVVWRAPSVDLAIALMAGIQVLAAMLVWRQITRAVDVSLSPVEQAVEAERLSAVLMSAKNGDLTVRTQIRDGALGPIGRGLDELLDAFALLVNKVGAAASEVSSDAESIERFSRVLAERSNRQSTAIAEVARKLKGMGARSEEIGQIVELLEDVAAETNVLALNAALEASRAGAQGKGFGMVADEVRKLAERSAAATKDIGAFIQGIGATTDDTTRSVEEIRGLTEGVVTSASQTASAASGLLAAARTLSQTLIRLRVPGQDETALSRALRERRHEIARALEPLAPLLENARTPLGEALKEILVVLTEGTPRESSARSSAGLPAVSGSSSESASSDRMIPPAERTG